LLGPWSEGPDRGFAQRRRVSAHQGKKVGVLRHGMVPPRTTWDAKGKKGKERSTPRQKGKEPIATGIGIFAIHGEIKKARLSKAILVKKKRRKKE